MLQHEQPAATDTIPASQRRVTPAELTRALATIEAHKEEEARRQEEEERHLSGTLSIGQAVEELCLDSTPAEIWDQIESQRAQAALVQKERTDGITPEPGGEQSAGALAANEVLFHSQPTGYLRDDHLRQRQSRPLNIWTIVGIPGVSLILLFCWIISLQTNVPHYPASTQITTQQSFSPLSQVTATVDANFYQKLSLCTGPHPTYRVIKFTLFQPFQPAAEAIYPLRAVPDGYSVYQSPYMNAAMNGNMTAVVVRSMDDVSPLPDSSILPSAPAWQPDYPRGFSLSALVPMTRYSGRPYLRCWIAKNDIPSLIGGRHCVLYTDPDAPTAPNASDLVPVTVPVVEWDGPTLIPKSLDAVEASKMSAPSNQQHFLNKIAEGRIELPDAYRVALDKHAWENFPAITLPKFHPEAWLLQPSMLTAIYGNSPAALNAKRYETFDASSVVVPIAQIPDRQVFRSDAGMFLAGNPDLMYPPYSYLPSPPSSQMLVDTRPDIAAPYTFVKHDGHVYLRGWTEARLTERQMFGHVIKLSIAPSDTMFINAPVQIQLRVDLCHLWPSQGLDASELEATNINLDKYAWERW